MLPLYMDEHVPKAITIGLRLRGIDVLTVQEDNFASKSDPELLDRSLYLKRAIFTHDDDLLAEATRRQHSWSSILRSNLCSSFEGFYRYVY